jgi:hypothetical protein
MFIKSFTGELVNLLSASTISIDKDLTTVAGADNEQDEGEFYYVNANFFVGGDSEIRYTIVSKPIAHLPYDEAVAFHESIQNKLNAAGWVVNIDMTRLSE